MTLSNTLFKLFFGGRKFTTFSIFNAINRSSQHLGFCWRRVPYALPFLSYQSQEVLVRAWVDSCFA